MSLLCLVIVGKENEPLYQRDFGSPDEDGAAAVVSDDEADCFGFASAMRSTENTISLRHEVSFDVGNEFSSVHRLSQPRPFLVHDAFRA